MSSSLSSKEQYYQYVREKQALLEEVQRLRRQVHEAQVAIQRNAGGSEQLITQNINLACRNFVSVFNLKLILVKSRAFVKWIAFSSSNKAKALHVANTTRNSNTNIENNIKVDKPKAIEYDKENTCNEDKNYDTSFTSTRSAFSKYRGNNQSEVESSVKALKNQGESKAILIDDLPFFKKAASRKIEKEQTENHRYNENTSDIREIEDDVLLGLSELLQDATAEEREIFTYAKKMYSSKQPKQQPKHQQPYYFQEEARGRSATRAVPTRVLTAPLTPNSMSHVRRLASSSSVSPTLTVRSSRSTSSYVSTWGKDSWRTDCDSVSVRKQRQISGESSLLRDTQKSFARRRALSADRKPVSPPRPALTGIYRHLDKRQQALLRGDFEDEHHGINHKSYWSQPRSLASPSKRFVT